jgi:hypothetical protein
MVRIRWARSARKHRIRRDRIAYVIEHCGLVFRLAPPAGSTASATDRLLYLGDDANGVGLEVMAVELGQGDLLVIHAMPLRSKYQIQYQEAQQWRT